MILCDESSQAVEPRVLIPLQLADRKTVVVFSGDDQQIAPRVQSASAKHHGLDVSIIHRLVGHYRHNVDRCDPLVSPRGGLLNENYRCHPDIVNLASELFYDSSLKPMADKGRLGVLDQFSRLPVRGKPLAFLGIRGYVPCCPVCIVSLTACTIWQVDSVFRAGSPRVFVFRKDEQIQGDTSWVNKFEAQSIVDLCRQLVQEYPKVTVLLPVDSFRNLSSRNLVFNQPLTQFSVTLLCGEGCWPARRKYCRGVWLPSSVDAHSATPQV